MRRFVSVATFVLAGCGLFTGGDDQQCQETAVGGIAEAPLRDPQTGVCDLQQPVEPTCPTGCVCAEPANGLDTPAVIGGECGGPCSSLDELSCISDNQCHAAYTDNGSGQASFWQCFDIAPQEPQPQPCAGLEAYACFFDPSCGSLYSDTNGNTEFESCIDVGSNSCNCGSGESCVTECPACVENGSACSCTQVCEPQGSGCDLQCPGNEQCELQCSGSGCQAVCAPDVGQCTGQITCNLAPPQCPQGTTAGIDNGCYTGYCIPLADCSPSDCASLTDESSCTARSDCEAVYTGSNCTCDDSGCTCTTLTFERCESLNGSGG